MTKIALELQHGKEKLEAEKAVIGMIENDKIMQRVAQMSKTILK